MNDLVKCVEYINQLMAKSAVPPSPAEVKLRIRRLFEEGISFKEIISQFIARQHAKHEQKILGETTTDILTWSDLYEVERALRVNEQTPANKECWEEKFKSGRAMYWCPNCGYSGNDEFRTFPNGTEHLKCYQCGYLEDLRYFTRSWTPEEQAAFEADRAAKRAASEAKRLKDAKINATQTTQWVSIQDDALKAAKAVDEFIWVEMGDDADSYSWDAASSGWMLRRVGQLMLRTEAGGDELVAYFKENLRPPENLSGVRGEFDRVAAMFANQFKREKRS